MATNYSLNLVSHIAKVILKLDLAHRKTDANCIHRKDNAPKPLGPITVLILGISKSGGDPPPLHKMWGRG